MAKTDLGTKRHCESCESKFYDLGRTPIVCPKCDTVFVEAKPAPKPKKPVEKKPEAKAETDKVTAAPEPEPEEGAKDSAELVSLEEADEERGAGEEDTDKDNAADGDDIDVSDIVLDDDDDDEKAEDDTFLEDDDDDDSNVADLVGGAESDDEV